MKTTIDLPDELLIRAKKRSAELRRPLRALFEDALREHLSRRNKPGQRPRKIRWVTAPGGLPPGVEISDRALMHEWLRGQQ